MTADRGRLNKTSERIIGCAFAVSNGLGSGFLEKVYENALAHELPTFSSNRSYSSS
jgi:GxxExxY protein